MTAEKVIEVARKYAHHLKDCDYASIRYPAGRLVASPHDAFCHARWMCDEIVKFCDEDRLEKAMRWLGFVQGLLWSWEMYTIDQLKDDNRPEKEG